MAAVADKDVLGDCLVVVVVGLGALVRLLAALGHVGDGGGDSVTCRFLLPEISILWAQSRLGQRRSNKS